MNSKDPYRPIYVSKNQIYLLKTFSKSFVNLFIVICFNFEDDNPIINPDSVIFKEFGY